MAQFLIIIRHFRHSKRNWKMLYKNICTLECFWNVYLLTEKNIIHVRVLKSDSESDFSLAYKELDGSAWAPVTSQMVAVNRRHCSNTQDDVIKPKCTENNS